LGQTYFFDCIGEKGELGTVTTATVLESEKKAYVTVATEDGVNHIIAEPISDFAKAGLRIVAVRHRINLPYEHPLSESPRKPTQTATTRQACQAS
jgi:hypothetical protein